MNAVAATAIVFDLDDTLFEECEFLHSGYREIARRLSGAHGLDVGELNGLMLGADNAFDALARRLNALGLPEDVKWMLDVYRTHMPDIKLDDEVRRALEALRRRGCMMRVLTEGRTVTQGNKIRVLGLDELMTHSAIIAPPRERSGSGKSFAQAAADMPAARYVSVGDNPAKDFSEPRSMGWLTVAVADRGRNIHPQDFTLCRPDVVIDSVARLPELLFP